MRVLFSSTFGYGHILAMFPLARAFQLAGHEVSWATSADACAIVQAAGIQARPTGLSGTALRVAVGRLQHAAAAVAPVDRAAFMFPAMFGELLTPPMAADLIPLARSWRPDLMIHEHGELASPLVGALIGVPSLTHSFGGAIPAAIMADAADRLAPLWRAHGLDAPEYAGAFVSTYLDICPSSVQSVPMSHIPDVQMLRPVDGAASRGEKAAAAAGPPLVYVTLGTVQNHAPALLSVVRALSVQSGPLVRMLVAVGPDRDPASLGVQPAHVRVERWVDQAQAIQDCTVVVSHGGSGTFLGALAAGRPQLCLPQAADQFRNAGAGSRAGAAMVLPPADVSEESVAAAVGRLLAEGSFREGARRVATEIAAMPSPADVVTMLAGRAR